MGNSKVHFMGIAGAGVSAVAAFAKAAGYEVSGCDIDSSSQFLKPLNEKGVEVFSEHSSDHLGGVDFLVVSPAIESLDPDNSELSLARQKRLKIMIGEEFLARYLIKDKKVIAITGTHGKSTTTAMVGGILETAGLDPNVFVGAVVLDWGTNFRIGKGEYFVLEADEYQEKFLVYKPYVLVITAVEMDHPEYFKDQEEVKEAFEKFAKQTDKEGYVILGKNVSLDTSGLKTKIAKKKNFELKLLGDLNQVNASLAASVGEELGIKEEDIETALKRFSGISRRFEFKGEEAGVKVFDDYGHHPTAIRETTKAAIESFPNQRIWLVYQPHMFTRTKYLFDEFVEVFKNLDLHEIVLVDIFAARQENNENISSKDIVNKVEKSNTKYIGDFEETAYYLAKNLANGDVVLMMGAGDIYKLSGLLLEKLGNKS